MFQMTVLVVAAFLEKSSLRISWNTKTIYYKKQHCGKRHHPYTGLSKIKTKIVESKHSPMKILFYTMEMHRLLQR